MKLVRFVLPTCVIALGSGVLGLGVKSDRPSLIAAERLPQVPRFDPSKGEFPEGIAFDPRGNLYVSLSRLGQIRKLMPDGTSSIFAVLDPAIAQGPGALGLATDPPGNVYAALVSFNPQTHGVWRITPAGEMERLPGSEQIRWPNSLVFDHRNNLYVTDTLVGAVWRIPPDGPVERWIQHPLLQGTGELPDPQFPLPLGANGIAFRDGSLYIANTEGARIVEIPIEPDGQPGLPRTLIESRVLFPLDGIALDVYGNLYAMVIGRHEIVRISPDGGHVATMARAEDGLDFPVNAAFGTGVWGHSNLYVVNFAVFPTDRVNRPGPGVVVLAAGVPGLPLR